MLIPREHLLAIMDAFDIDPPLNMDLDIVMQILNVPSLARGGVQRGTVGRCL